MSPGIKPVKRAIQHVRNPRQRMPIAGVHRPDRPVYATPGKTLQYRWILSDILVIIREDKIVMAGRPVKQQRPNRQKRTDVKRRLFAHRREGRPWAAV